MTDKLRLRIAAAVTAAFIAAVSFAGVSTHSSRPVGAVVQPAGVQAPSPSNAGAASWQQGQEHD